MSVSPYLHGCDRHALAAFCEAGADQVILTAFARDEDDLRRTLDELADEMLVRGPGF